MVQNESESLAKPKEVPATYSRIESIKMLADWSKTLLVLDTAAVGWISTSLPAAPHSFAAWIGWAFMIAALGALVTSMLAAIALSGQLAHNMYVPISKLPSIYQELGGPFATFVRKTVDYLHSFARPKKVEDQPTVEDQSDKVEDQSDKVEDQSDKVEGPLWWLTSAAGWSLVVALFLYIGARIVISVCCPEQDDGDKVWKQLLKAAAGGGS